MHVAVNACLWPLCAVHGKAVTTVEGVGDTDTGLHAVQVTIVTIATIFHTRGFKLAEQLVVRTLYITLFIIQCNCLVERVFCVRDQKGLSVTSVCLILYIIDHLNDKRMKEQGISNTLEMTPPERFQWIH